MIKLITYFFKWPGPVSFQQSKTGGFQRLAAHISYRRDLAYIVEGAPNTLFFK